MRTKHSVTIFCLSVICLFILTVTTHAWQTPTSDTSEHAASIVSRQPVATFLVTNTQNSGVGSLRQAIIDANANPSPPSNVVFNIPTSDPNFDGVAFTIQPTSALPTIRNNVTIDGSTQTVFSGDTNPDGPEIVLNGTLQSSGHGLVLSGDSSQVSYLVINGFQSGYGVRVFYSPDPTPSHNQIAHNYIGTDATGMQAVPNAGGMVVTGVASPTQQAFQNVIQNNLISGNSGNGLDFCDARSTTVANNLIGTDRTGASGLGNAGHGVGFYCAGAPNNQIVENVIAFNEGAGIFDMPDYRFATAYTPDGHQGNRFSQNAIYANGSIGINLLPPPFGYFDEVTPNDPGDTDIGGNLLQNYPVLTEARSDGITLAITGTLNSNANQSFTVELFLNNSVDPSGHGEGEIYLGSLTVATGSSGDGSFHVTLPQEASIGQAVSATATDAAGNTSEFSAAVVVVVNQPPTAVVGGPYATVEGMAIVLDASGSFDADGAITSYEWDLDNDGEYNDATGITTTVTFADNGNYPVGLRVTDDGGLTGEDSVIVTVDNVDPALNNVVITSPIDEYSLATLIGNLADPGIHDSFRLAVDWGDGQEDIYDYAAGTANFAVTHLYLDDHPSGSYTVTLILTDKDDGMAIEVTTVVVQNVAPLVNAGADQTIKVGVPATFAGSFTDPGVQDTHLIHWEFGNGHSITGTLTPTYIYPTYGTYIVTLTITDDDGGIGSDTVVVVIQPYSLYLPMLHKPNQP